MKKIVTLTLVSFGIVSSAQTAPLAPIDYTRATFCSQHGDIRRVAYAMKQEKFAKALESLRLAPTK